MNRRIFPRLGGRALTAFGSNAGLGVGSLALNVAVARSVSASEYGQFAMAFLGIMFMSGALRAALTETAIANHAQIETVRRVFCRLSAAGIFLTVLIVVTSLITSSLLIFWVGLAIHGYTLFDSIRIYEGAVGDVQASRRMGVVSFLGLLVVSGIVVTTTISMHFVFALSMTVFVSIAYFTLWRLRIDAIPRWGKARNETKTAILFSLDYAVGSGGALVSTGLLGVVFSPVYVSGLRGAGTVLGPINIISSAARSLIIGHLSNFSIQGDLRERREAVRLTIILSLGALIMASPIVLLPDSIGAVLLGDTWPPASKVLLPMAIESILALITAVPASGLRMRGAAGMSLTMRVIIGVPRPFIIIWAGVHFGLSGAAWAMTIIAALNAVIWWIGYLWPLRTMNKL